MAQGFSLEEALGKGTQATGGFSLEEALGRKPEESGLLRQAADIPLSIGRGALTGVRMVADAFGAGSRASEAIKGAEGYVAGLMSAQARNDEQEIARIMKDAEDKGVLDQVQAAFKAFSVAPVDLLTQGLGTAGVGILGMLGGKVLGAGTLGLRAIGAATGAGMGAGAAKGGIYEEVKSALIEAGENPQKAEQVAQQAQAYGGKNLDQILLGTALGAVSGGVGLEGVASRILSRAATKEAAGQAAKGAIREAGEGALKTAAVEGLPEYLQGSQEQLAQNIALQREGFDVDTMRGIVGSGVLEGLAGAGLGAIAGGTEAGLRRQARDQAQRILAEEEKQRIAQEEQAERQRIAAERAAEEERMRPVREAEQRDREAAEARTPYYTRLKKFQLELQQEKTPEAKEELAFVNSEIARLNREQIERQRSAAKAQKQSVFAEAELPAPITRDELMAPPVVPETKAEIPGAKEPTFNLLRSLEARNQGLMTTLEARRTAAEEQAEVARQERESRSAAERADADRRMSQVENFLLSPARKTQQETAEYIADVVPEMRKDFLALLDEDLNQPLTPEQTEALKTQIRQRLMPEAAPEPEVGRTRFKSFLATMGINKKDARDIFGDNAFKANQRLPGAIRANAPSLDMLAEAAVEAGFLQTEDPNALVQMIKDEFFGVEQVPLDMADERAAAEFEERLLGELQSSAAEIGLDTRGMTPEQIIGRLNRIERTREKQRQRRERETEARTEADIAEATAAEREARAEALGAEAVPEVEALRKQAQDKGIDVSDVEYAAFEEARDNPDLNPDTILAERLSDALGMPRYQRETTAGESIGKEQTQSIVDAVKSQWKNAPEVVVAENMDDPSIPAEIRTHNKAAMQRGAKGRPKGFFYNGKAYILADAATSPKGVIETLFHEALGHYGLRGTFGPEMEAVLKDVVKYRRAEVEAKAKQYGLDPKSESDMLEAAEEVLAVIAETKPGLSFVKRAIAAIRNFLRDMGLPFKMSNEDIIQKYILPARAFVEKGGSRAVEGKPAAMLSFDNESGNFNPDLDKYWINQGKKEINGEGMSDSEYNTAVAEYANAWRIDELLEKMGWKRRGSSNVSASTYFQKDIELDEPNADGEDTLTYEVRVSDHGDRHPADGTIKRRFQINFRTEPARWSDVDVTPDMTTAEAIAALEGALNTDFAAPDSGGVSFSRSESKPAAMREGRVPQTETEEFKRWFGNSKVVDAEGKPLVVYHGTGSDISTFKPSNSGSLGEGIYFTNDANAASRFAERKSESMNVMPVYIKAENILDADNITSDQLAALKSAIPTTAEELVKLGYPADLARDSKEFIDQDLKRIQEARSFNPKSLSLAVEGGPISVLESIYKAAGFDAITRISDGLVGQDPFREYLVFRPNQIKSATGNIGAFGQRPVTKEEATRFGMTEKEAEQAQVRGDIRYQREAEPKPKQTRLNIAGEPVLGSWNIQVDPKLELQDGLIYKFLDKNIDVKRIVQSIEKLTGEIAQRWNPYLQEELYHGRTAAATQEFADDEWQPLLKEMDKQDVTIGELEQYLHNRHAEDYNKLVAKRNPTRPEMQDGGSQIKTEDARKYLSDLSPEKRKKYEALAKRIDDITKGTRQLLVKNGYETPERIEAWEKAFPNYVPLMREEGDFDYNFGSFGTGRGFDVRRDFSRSAMGSKRQVVDIIGNIIAARNNAIMLTEKNRVAQAVYGLAVQNPNPDFWMAINPEAEKVPEAAIDELRELGISEDAVKFLMKEPRQRRLDPKKNEILSSINQTLRQNDYVLATRINGERRYVFFNPKDERSKRAVTALKNLDAENLGMALGAIAKVTRWMASVNTQYNPIFGIYNFLRDTQAAALQLSTTPLAGKQLEVSKEILPSLRAIYGSLRKRHKGEKVDTEMAKLWKEFQKEGGQTGFKDVFSRTQDRQEALVNEMMRIKEGKTMKAGRAIVDWLSDYNDTLENAVRLSAYKVAKKKFIDEGKTETDAKQLAASLAKNLTVNFNRKGDAALQAGALYAFFNASMQGTARAYQTIKGPMGKKILAGGLLWGVIQASIYALAGFDEDEPPEFVRERNIVIPTGDGDYLAFPMPLGYHVIPGFSRIISEWALSGFKDTPDRIASLTGMFLEAFNPIGNAGWSVQSISPTAFDPIVGLAENRDWTGKPIAKEDMFSLDPTPGYTRARDGANVLTSGIAKFLNFATGGTRADPGLVSPTPEQIEYLIGQALGGIGREVTKGVTSIEKAVTGEELPPYKIPLYGRFVGETKSSAAESNRFYKNMEKLNILDREIKVRRENREPIGDFMRENPEARLAPMAQKTYRDIQELRKRREKLVERDAPRESVKSVEEQIRRRMAMFNERVAQLRD